jgi:hypothetical protein
MNKLNDAGFKVAFVLYDQKLFDTLVRGTNLIQQFVWEAPPEERLQRFGQIKAAIEQLREQRPSGSHP